MNDTTDMVLARTVLLSTSIIMCIIWSIVLVLEIWSFLEFINYSIDDLKNNILRRTGLMRNRETFVRLLLFVSSAATVAPTFEIIYIETSQPFEISNQLCASLGILLSCSYMVSMQSLYLFFVIKASAVEGFIQSTLYKRVGMFVKMFVIIFIPCIIIPLLIAFWGGMVLSSGHCVMISLTVWLAPAFASGNFAISLALLYLFVEPLRQNEKLVAHQNQGMSELLKSTVKKNVILSMLAVSSNIIIESFLAVVHVVTLDPTLNGNGQLDYLHVWFLFCPLVDLGINALCAKLMTNLWLPKRFRNLCQPTNHRNEQNNIRVQANEEFQRANGARHIPREPPPSGMIPGDTESYETLQLYPMKLLSIGDFQQTLQSSDEHSGPQNASTGSSSSRDRNNVKSWSLENSNSVVLT